MKIKNELKYIMKIKHEIMLFTLFIAMFYSEVKLGSAWVNTKIINVHFLLLVHILERYVSTLTE